MNLTKSIDWLTIAGIKPENLKLKHLIRYVHEELEEFEEAVLNENELEMYDALSDAIIFITNLMYKYNLTEEQLNIYYDKVVLSNWSKFCHSEEEAIETVNSYKNGTHKTKLGIHIDTYYTKENNYWIVKQTSDNKILKSINYKEPSEF